MKTLVLSDDLFRELATQIDLIRAGVAIPLPPGTSPNDVLMKDPPQE